ncbi:alpha/beta hydrolase [Erythrobacter sp.]|uniref:alpha/beta fold hydrolase n=1 Tax=Erythrobacter sp. TaxID=1042 RepID=UPI001AFD918D|nr:alpha/beta hydrolase [Erythrobacter sp.]MBO6527561.1 alpha/beta hydrolase [Erythrobacter sp.]MBO6530241.1 alpha/beta hydrolase [Erythrobacter sp.]
MSTSPPLLAAPTFVTVRGKRYAQYDGGGSGEVVLLLHGWPDDATIWRHQFVSLGEVGYRPVALDWIGHGSSEKIKDVSCYTRRELGLDLVELIDRLGGRVHLVAHDYGAVVAWQFASDFPDRLVSFQALSIGHPAAILRYPSLSGFLKNWFLIYNALPFAVAGYRAFDAAFFRWAMRHHPDRDHVVARFMEELDPFYIRVWERANPLSDFISQYQFAPWSGIPKVAVPTQGLWGTRDEYATRIQMEKSARLINGDWNFTALPDLGHWSMLQDPARVTEQLLAWTEAYPTR